MLVQLLGLTSSVHCCIAGHGKCVVSKKFCKSDDDSKLWLPNLLILFMPLTCYILFLMIWLPTKYSEIARKHVLL